MKKQSWVCFDFDGVLAKYNGWKGFDVLGNPIDETIKALIQLKAKGYKITILTTRLDTPTLREWLHNNGVPYDSINSNAHNPPNTSQKPIYDIIVDDRAVRYDGQGTESLLQEIERVIETNVRRKEEQNDGK